jgi:hypothetical protein
MDVVCRTTRSSAALMAVGSVLVRVVMEDVAVSRVCRAIPHHCGVCVTVRRSGRCMKGWRRRLLCQRAQEGGAPAVAQHCQGVQGDSERRAHVGEHAHPQRDVAHDGQHQHQDLGHLGTMRLGGWERDMVFAAAQAERGQWHTVEANCD